MNREEFDAHVRAVERRFQGRPVALRMRLAALAAVGYAGLLAGFVLVFALASVFLVPAWILPIGEGWPFWFLGIGGLLGGAVAVSRALWVRITPPEGCVVTRREAPALHGLLDELRGKLHAGRFHRVVVTGVANAAVSEVPRLGVLGWPRHWLQLGLPLLESLSAAELRAVVAHEFAHLSGRHGRFGTWIYRLRRSWDQVFARLHEPRVEGAISLRPLLLKFIDWFWPRFNAHAFVLSRANEFDADAVAARLAGAENIATALLQLELRGRLLGDKFWPDLWLDANRSAEPPRDVFLRLRDTLRAPPPAEARTWLEQAFRWTTSIDDTHPCLSERLRAVGQLPAGVERGDWPPWPAAPIPNAAESLLGKALEKVRADVDAAWRKDSAENWRARHSRAAALNDRLAGIDSGRSSETDPAVLWERAGVLMNLDGDAAAAPVLRQLTALRPDHAGANFCLGRHLLAENDPAGEAHLERAMATDEDSVPGACELLLIHYRRLGQTERIRETQARLDRHEAAVAASHTERLNVTASDTFIPHTLTPAELCTLRAVLAADPMLASADLAQKEMRHFPKQRLFVLCLRTRRAWYQLPNSDMNQAAVARLLPKIRLPGRQLVIAPHGGFRTLAALIARVPSARVFPDPRVENPPGSF